METKAKQSSQIPTDPEEQAKYLMQILIETQGRDLFPEKTASARRFLEKLKESQQTLLPK